MIILSGYTKIQNDSIYFQELAQDNLESGKNLVLYGDAEPFGQFSNNLYASPIDSYHVKSEVWGMYGLMHVTGVHGPAHARQSFLFGARPEGLFTTSLFLEDRNRPLIIAGATILQGKLLLPEAGLKSGFIGRQGFTGPKLHDGPIANSTDTPFDLHYPDLTQITTILDQLRNGNVQPTTNNAPQATNNSPLAWNAPPTVLADASEIILDQTTHTGKIILIAPKVTLRKEAHISDIIIVANAVHIDSGFNGRLQIFANDSIIVEPNCRLNYPSALVLATYTEF
ncbi:MAG TPA: hypothetical protein VHS96_07205, partial [Bacteroidia bacterium]|nr:hypothetical protein [Bacteroidia bacterium]